MEQNDKIQLFENKRIRTAWDEEKEEWYFSIVDVVAVLTDQPSYEGARNYWKVLKNRLAKEGSQLVTECNQLKMTSPKDGKSYNTDVANTQQLLRIVQSIPSPKAEPFKLWLAEVGRERIEETIDPELTIERALATYLRKGYTREWINQRLQAIQVRKELTDEWDARGVQKALEPGGIQGFFVVFAGAVCLYGCPFEIMPAGPGALWAGFGPDKGRGAG